MHSDCASLGEIMCVQSTDYIIDSCEEDIADWVWSILEEHLPGYLMTEIAGQEALICHTEAIITSELKASCPNIPSWCWPPCELFRVSWPALPCRASLGSSS